MAEPAPKWDLGAQAANQLQMVLGNILTMWGLSAEVYETIIYENEYAQIAPEQVLSQLPSRTIRVLVGSVMQGLNFSGPFISLSDKVQKEVTIITNDTSLQINDELKVTFSDNKTLKYRITVPLALNAYSQLTFAYKAVLL